MAQNDDLIFFTGLLKQSLLVMGMWPLKTDDHKLKILYKVYGKIIQTIFAVIVIGVYSFIPRLLSEEPELLFDQAVLIIVYTIIAVKMHIITKGRLYEMIQNLARGETGNYPPEIRAIYKKHIKSCEMIYKILFYWAMIGAATLSIVSIQDSFFQDNYPGTMQQPESGYNCSVNIDPRGENNLVEGNPMKMASKNYSRLIDNNFLIPINNEEIDYFTHNRFIDLVEGHDTAMMSRNNSQFTGRNKSLRNNQNGNDLFDLNISNHQIKGNSTEKMSNNMSKFFRRNRFKINTQIRGELFDSKHLVEGHPMKMASKNYSQLIESDLLIPINTDGLDNITHNSSINLVEGDDMAMTSINNPKSTRTVYLNTNNRAGNKMFPQNNSMKTMSTKYINRQEIKTMMKVPRDNYNSINDSFYSNSSKDLGETTPDIFSHNESESFDYNDPMMEARSMRMTSTVNETSACNNVDQTSLIKRRRLIYNTWSPYDTNDYYVATMTADLVLLFYCCFVCCMTDGVFITLIISSLCRLKVLRVYMERYHLEEWYLGDVFGDVGRSDGDDLAYRNLRACIIEHQALIRYMEDLDSSVNFMMFLDFLTHSMQLATILMLLTMIPVSLKLFWAFNYFTYVLMQLYFFYWWSNEIQLESVAVSNSIYDSDWYNQSPRMRIMLLIIMSRAQRSLKLHIGPLYDVSNEVLVKILRTFYSLVSILQNFNGN